MFNLAFVYKLAVLSVDKRKAGVQRYSDFFPLKIKKTSYVETYMFETKLFWGKFIISTENIIVSREDRHKYSQIFR